MAGFKKPVKKKKEKHSTICVQIFTGNVEAEAFRSHRTDFHINQFIWGE